MARTTINEPVRFAERWIRSGFLAYSIFVLTSIIYVLGEGDTGAAAFEAVAVWTFLFGPILAGLAFIDARKINVAIDLSYNVQIIKAWVWVATILAFSPVTFWIYVIQRRHVTSDYPAHIMREQKEKVRNEFGYSVKVSSLWYPAAIVTYFIAFYISLFYLLGGYSITYAVVPWIFIYGPLIGLFVLLDAWKVNAVSKDRHLNQTFWALFVWLFSFFGFWFYFLERRSTIRTYSENERKDRPKVEQWSARLYDLVKVSLNRIFFRIRQATGERETYRGESSKQRASGGRKKSTLDSQIIWALGVFGLDSDASKDLVRKKYRELMNDYHPDRLGQATDAQRKLVEEKAKEINRAHDLLERYFVGGTRSATATLFESLVRAIEEFTPSTVWNNESGYHAELYSVLKQRFPELSVDSQKDSSRPDLVIQDIGIEVKGPTDGGELKTLPDECLRYSPHYQNLIFVLFKPEFTELLYKEICDGISRTYPNVKIIRKA